MRTSRSTFGSSAVRTLQNRRFLGSSTVVLAAILVLLVARAVPRADGAAQWLPFAQDWSATSSLIVNDNWDSVPGITGYRGDDLTTSTGTDPQTILADGTSTPVDANVNQTSPNTFATGGVAEFEITDPTIALNGSGTADAPFMLISVNTTGRSGIGVSYRLRDLDGSADNAVQSVALHFRVGNSGSFTNVPAAFVADATAGPNLAGLETPVSVTIPAAADNRPLVQLRIMTTNAVGNDEWVGVDDISITGTDGGAPVVSINDVTVAEGDSGTTTATFTVSVSTSAHSGVGLDIVTADGSGPSAATTADNDYVFRSESVVIPAGETAYAFDVTINADILAESDETFLVNLSNVSGAALADGQGIGTIANDDAQPVMSDVVISQVYGGGGNAGAALTHDFVELFNRGLATVSLDGWSVQYTSAGGSGTWTVTPLGGSIAPGSYYLIRQGQGSGGTTALPTPDLVGSTAMGASAGKVALQTTTAPIAGACPSGATADLVGYGATANCFEGAGATVAPSNTVAALRKRGGCFDSDNNSIDFLVGEPIPRNSSSPARSCTPAPASIAEIQGAGLASASLGQDVTTGGIVTSRKANGFFLQAPDAAADGDPQTSEGIFVFTSAVPAVTAGDAVSIRGTVGEYFGLTQIESSLPGDVTVTSTGNALPSPITLTSAVLDPSGTPAQLERLEGMRVYAPSLTTVAPTDQYGEIATVVTGVPRPVREPGIPVLDPVPPDPTSGVPDCCIPRFDGNPERVFIDSDGLVGTSVLTVTSNVVLENVTGPLDFTFGAYKILPEAPPVAGANMSGVPVPPSAADEFTVGVFNIENFTGDETRRRKSALAIRQLMQSPDVIGHIEILDEPTLQALADQVNADAVAAGEPDPQYQGRLVVASRQDGSPSTQNVGFLVKTARVRIDQVSAEPAGTFINPNTGQFELLHDRPPLVLRATADPLGPNPHPVIVVVNHLRSFIDIELVDGEGPRVRAKRTAQAESVAQLLQNLQTLNPGTPVIALGDYNAYQFNDGYTDPIATIAGRPTPDDQVVVDDSPDHVDPDFVNLTDMLPSHEQYSFVFEGTPQALDHVLLNTVAASSVRRYAIARGNADFPGTPAVAFASDATRPERASDHDMPVAYFRFPDTIAPVFDEVNGVTVPSTSFDGAVVTYALPTATDNIDGTVPVVCAPAPGARFPIGDTTVWCTASDAAGNEATASFVVTVEIVEQPGLAIGAGQAGRNPRVTFTFLARQTAAGGDSGWLLLTAHQPGGRPRSFVALAVDEVAFVGGAVRFTGTGWWKGGPMHAFEVVAYDNGEPGRNTDTFSVIIRSPDGSIVLESSGALTAGNVQALR